MVVTPCYINLCYVSKATEKGEQNHLNKRQLETFRKIIHAEIPGPAIL